MSSQRILMLVLAAAYAALFHWAYRDIASPDFLLSGLDYRPLDDGSLVIGFALAVAPALWLPIAVERPSQVIRWMLYAIVYVPCVLVPYYVLGIGLATLPLTISLTAAFALLALVDLLPTPRLPSLLTSSALHRLFVVCIAAMLSAYLISVFGVDFEFPDLSDIYVARADYKEDVAEAGVAVAYAMGWTGNVLYPALLVFGLAQRRLAFVLLGLCGLVFVYSVTGFRSVLVAIPLAIALVTLLGSRRSRFGLLFLGGLAVVVLLSSVVSVILNEGLLSAILLRRLLAVPGQLTAYYYEFFSQYPTYALSHSVLSEFNPRPYPAPPSQLIAAVYFNNPNANANANLWADGLANFGLLGIFAATAVLAFMLKVVDGVAAGRRLQVAGPILAVGSLGLLNSAVLTSILSHGMAAAAILVLLMPLGRRIGQADRHRPWQEGTGGSGGTAANHTLREG